MAWPINSPGNPFGFQQGLEEGFETYYGGGSYGGDYYSHQHPAPVYNARTWQQTGSPWTWSEVASAYAADPYDWVAASQPRTPSTPGWKVAPTPVPATELDNPFPPGISAPSGSRTSDSVKKAPKKELSTEEPSGYLVASYRGRKASWP